MALTLSQASNIADAALEFARSKKMNSIGVVVLDARAVPVAFLGEDGGGLFRFDIARGKANGCLGFNRGGAAVAKLAEARPHFSAAVVEISGGRFTPVQGGVLIRDNHGNILGAVGVSGDTSENDEACAVAGIEAAGLKADTGA